MNELHDSVEMAQVVEALEPSKKWEVEELDSQQLSLTHDVLGGDLEQWR
ncbi:MULTISPECIES: hypothetical protein [Corynebacterium]|nr:MULTISPECIES: hypothetical protein [Corynebacterium]QNP92045.1 hypothetical protein IAU67_08495 [Corynebacterium zhongnanshanii]